MGQKAFQLSPPAGSFIVEGPLDAATVYTRVKRTVNWKSGSPDVLLDHSAATLWGSTNHPDLTAGTVYLLFVIQGEVVLWLTAADNATQMDALVGAGTIWGPIGWVDQDGVHDWQQY